MAKADRVRKRCARCGAVAVVQSRQTRCYVRKFGKGSYCCWGELSRVERKRRVVVSVRQAVQAMAVRVDTEEQLRAQRGATHRKQAARKLAAAQAGRAKLATRVKRLQTALRKRQLQVKRLERLAGLTDAEVQAVRERAQHACHVQKVRRRLLGAKDPETASPAVWAARGCV